MLPIRIPNPWHVLADEFDTFPSLGAELFVNVTPTLLLTDVVEHRDYLLVSINLPGAIPMSISASLGDQRLFVAARLETIELSAAEPSAAFLWRERPTGLVQRTIPLPGQLSSIASATFEHGVLLVCVDKALTTEFRTIHIAAHPSLEARADIMGKP
jgi:HSP20 family molecular chaperone IbpA